MNRSAKLTCALVLCGAVATATSFAADAPKSDPAKDAAMAEMMKYANPGPQHAKLKEMEGKWKAVVKSWYGGPEPTVSEGTSDNKLIMGGRYLEGRFKGEYNGEKFDGYSLTGYDMKKNALISFWMDSMSTTWMTQSGTISADGKEMTLTGMADGMDGKPAEMKSVTKIVDPNKHVFTMSTMAGGKEVTMMEITYTRI